MFKKIYNYMRKYSAFTTIFAVFTISIIIAACSTNTIRLSGNGVSDFKIVEFRGRIFAIGGSSDNGSGEVSGRDLFEITDNLKAFYYRSGLYNSDSFNRLKADEYKSSGRLLIENGFSADAEFIEFKNKVYMIGGKSQNSKNGDVYVSEDMLSWKTVLKDAPWKNVNPRVGHKLGVFNGMIYIAGGSSYEDIWRSPNGIDWFKICSLQRKVKQLFVWNETFFLHARDDRGNILYSTKDGLEWKIEDGFPRRDNVDIVFFDKKLFAAASHSIYSSKDGSKWDMILNSPSVSTPCGVYNDMLYIQNLEGLEGICFTGDGVNWKSAVTGDEISLIPYDMGGGIKNNYGEYSVVGFKNSGWIIGESPDRIYKTSDGLNWKKIEVNPANRFIHRSKAAVGVFNGFMYISGGVWTGNMKNNPRKYYIVMNDIWRSSNGIDWKLVSNNAPWDKMMSGELVSFNNRFLLFGGDRYGGDGSELQVWYSSDGINWGRNTDSDGQSKLTSSDIRNSYIGIAELNGKIYLTDKHIGSDILITSDGNKYYKQKVTGDMDEYNIRLNNCVTIQFDGKEYVVLKKGDEFFSTSDFNRWEKLSFNFADNYKGEENFDGYTLYKIGTGLFLVNVKFDDKTVINSVVIKINLKRDMMTFTNFKSVEL